MSAITDYDEFDYKGFENDAIGTGVIDPEYMTDFVNYKIENGQMCWTGISAHCNGVDIYNKECVPIRNASNPNVEIELARQKFLDKWSGKGCPSPNPIPNRYSPTIPTNTRKTITNPRGTSIQPSNSSNDSTSPPSDPKWCHSIPPTDFWCDPMHQMLGGIGIGAVLFMLLVRK